MPDETPTVITDDTVNSLPGAPWGHADATITATVALINELVVSEWANPTADVPVDVRLVAINVARRALQPGASGITSVTVSTDDTSRTVRYSDAQLEAAGIYLTDDEKAVLAGGATAGRSRRRPRTIRTPLGY